MSRELPSFLIDAGELLQHVSRVVYRGSPLYYGRSSTNRYDDPARAYGVLYLGRDLPTALMESVFHKHQWLADTKRSIALNEVQSRMVRAVGVMADVLLADLARERALRQLSTAGARVWLAPGMVHAKAVVIDDSMALTGSVNLDARSLFLNYEHMTAFYDREQVQWLAHWCARHIATAQPHHARQPSWLRDIAEGVVRAVGFQL